MVEAPVQETHVIVGQMVGKEITVKRLVVLEHMDSTALDMDHV
jgi:hypothetical protein